MEIKPDLLDEVNKFLASDTLKKKNQDLTKAEESLKKLQNDYGNPKFIALNKVASNLRSEIEIIKDLETLQKRLLEAYTLKKDAELASLVQEEINEIEEQISAKFTEAEKLSRVTLPNDELKAIFEIRPGVGGVEASLFAYELMEMYLKYCTIKGYPVEIISIEYNLEGGINEGVFLIDNSGSYGIFRFESGVNRVQRVPVTESAGRIHTSTASVVIMPQFSNTEININPSDLRIDVFRSGGPGGQSVNTTDSAVRVTHLPTGIVVSCQNTKSQHKNKELALSILKSKLYEIELEKSSNEKTQIRKGAIQGGDRSSKIRTFNFPQSRFTDHRTGLTLYNLEAIQNGEIDQILDATSKLLRTSTE